MLQSTFPRGERLPKSLPLVCSPEFQSTFPRGERRAAVPEDPEADRFNPRSHEGNDFRKWALYAGYDVSIHVPTRGTTVNRADNLDEITVSIHVPTRGTT